MDERCKQISFEILHRDANKKLNNKINNKNLIVDFAMRYGNPSIESKIKLMQESGCEKNYYFSSISPICITNYCYCL